MQWDDYPIAEILAPRTPCKPRLEGIGTLAQDACLVKLATALDWNATNMGIYDKGFSYLANRRPPYRNLGDITEYLLPVTASYSKLRVHKPIQPTAGSERNQLAQAEMAVLRNITVVALLESLLVCWLISHGLVPHWHGSSIRSYLGVTSSIFLINYFSILCWLALIYPILWSPLRDIPRSKVSFSMIVQNY